MSAGTTYAPGGWVAVSGDRCWVLTGLELTDAPVHDLWSAVSQPTVGPEPVLDVLVGGGLADTPGFALVARQGEQLRYVVRHPGRLVALDGAGARTSYAAAPGLTWTDGFLPAGTSRVLLTAAETDPDDPGGPGGLPAASGVLAAGWLSIDLSPSPDVDAPVRVAEPEPTPRPAPVPEPEPAPEPEPVVTAAEEPDEAATYLELITVHTADREALLSRLATEDEPDEPPSAAHHTAVWEPQEEAVPAPPIPAPATPPPPAVMTGPGGLIDGVPWASSGGAPATPPPSTPAPTASAPTVPVPEDDPEDAASRTPTVTRAQLLTSLGEGIPSGPVVLAVPCARGHLTPPYLPTCRVCGGELTDRAPSEVLRPALGRLVSSSGATVVLDRGVVLGRAPQTDETDPAHRPHLARLAESDEISRSHASITLDGWEVQVRDLGSANGTTLTLPGAEPVLLNPQEPYPLEPGSVISLADVVSLRYEVAP